MYVILICFGQSMAISYLKPRLDLSNLIFKIEMILITKAEYMHIDSLEEKKL
jgi:hypothetical protein